MKVKIPGQKDNLNERLSCISEDAGRSELQRCSSELLEASGSEFQSGNSFLQMPSDLGSQHRDVFPKMRVQRPQAQLEYASAGSLQILSRANSLLSIPLYYEARQSLKEISKSNISLLLISIPGSKKS